MPQPDLPSDQKQYIEYYGLFFEATRLPRIFGPLLDVDNRPILSRIACPTLVIGGADDRVIPAEIQREMVALIPGSQIMLYPGYGHGHDQENPDCEVQVRRFVEKVEKVKPTERFQKPHVS